MNHNHSVKHTNHNLPLIEVSDLAKNFEDVQAVNGIPFHVNHGELFGFLGPNGAGKWIL